MGFSYSGGGQRRITTPLTPIEVLNPGANSDLIPSGSLGFWYWLVGGGGGGGSGGGGNLLGGGGGGAGNFTHGRVLLSELMEHFGVTSHAQLRVVSTIGYSGAGGVLSASPNASSNGVPGNSGGESLLQITTNGIFPISSITIATAQGGYGGLGGTKYQGFGFGPQGTTYSAIGGIGEFAQRKEYQSVDIARSTTSLNVAGDGGNGGMTGMNGLAGKIGYISIEFF